MSTPFAWTIHRHQGCGKLKKALGSPTDALEFLFNPSSPISEVSVEETSRWKVNHHRGNQLLSWQFNGACSVTRGQSSRELHRQGSKWQVVRNATARCIKLPSTREDSVILVAVSVRLHRVVLPVPSSSLYPVYPRASYLRNFTGIPLIFWWQRLAHSDSELRLKSGFERKRATDREDVVTPALRENWRTARVLLVWYNLLSLMHYDQRNKLTLVVKENGRLISGTFPFVWSSECS